MSRFNLRVYGLWLNECHEVLVSEETIKQRVVVKFPGGGLEIGEGLKDALIREWKEEMDVDIEVLRHYYTTDFYQPSAFDDSQVISVYYIVRPLTPLVLPYQNDRELSYFVPVNETLPDILSLPIDKVVGLLLYNEYKK